MLRAISHQHPHDHDDKIIEAVLLKHDERSLRRKIITTVSGKEILVDLPHTISFQDDDILLIEDGQRIKVMAAIESLYSVKPRDQGHLSQLAWHLGNRHLPTQIDEDRLLIIRDHVIKDMLEGLGAIVTEINDKFQPIHGAYHHHAHDHE